MKKALTILFLLISTLSYSQNYSKDIIGTWEWTETGLDIEANELTKGVITEFIQHPEGLKSTFSKDGTVSVVEKDGTEHKFNYVIEGNKIILDNYIKLTIVDYKHPKSNLTVDLKEMLSFLSMDKGLLKITFKKISRIKNSSFIQKPCKRLQGFFFYNTHTHTPYHN